MNGNNLEIERKYLIRRPEEARLAAMPGAEIWDLVQTYLTDGADGSTRRVRSVRTDGKTHYTHTVKHRVTVLSCEEMEEEISRETYDRLLADADPALNAIEKRRYRSPYAGQLLEIDLYSFWSDRATLEVELRREDQAVELPEWIELIREVTGERAYKNRYLAEAIPMEELR